MYRNLKAEMARYDIKLSRLALLLQLKEDTVRRKISGKISFTVDEAFIIQKNLFSNLQVQYLFDRDIAS